MEINSISIQKEPFLQRLTEIAKPPQSLYFTGVLPTHTQPIIAIVGTRKPTAYGKEIAYHFSYHLAKQGAIIVSGLALGVDGIAHTAALDAGGITVAVLGNGLPTIYPSSHYQLAKRIVRQGGAIISEYPENMPALPHQFLARNRLISGLSQAVVVIEAAARSGTLNTASHALESGKDVFAVPGNITSPLSAGCNALIRHGAQPALQPEDILQAIAPQGQARLPTQLHSGDNSDERTIIKLLQSGLRDGEVLFEKSGLSIATFNQTLTMLEIKGVIKALGAHQWALL